MKRITYISRIDGDLGDDNIRKLGEESERQNSSTGITGFLMFAGGIFYQIIEGKEMVIDRLFNNIRDDQRHKDIICLKTEYNVKERMFPDFSMKFVNLDDSSDELIKALNSVLINLTESHGIISRYTQPSVQRFMNDGINPLSIPLMKKDRIIMFTDLVSFTSLSEIYSVEKVVDNVNLYLDMSSRIISEAGGEVSKFIGDGILAYFPVDKADNALNSALSIFHALKTIREESLEGSLLKNLYCGCGISRGIVVEGNLGSNIKKDYTIIGDPVNTASRLDSLTREVGKALLMSEEFVKSLYKPSELVELGEFPLKGKKDKVNVFSLDHELVDDFKIFNI